MAGDQKNIIVGPAALSINSVDVGFTQGGVTFRKSKDFVDVDADQMGGVARKVATFERAFVTTTLLEATLNNIHKIMNEPSTNLSSSMLSFGTANPETFEYVLTVTGDAPDGGTRTYTFHRAVSVGEIDHMIGSRDNPSVIPVEFELLKDPANNSRFGYAVDTSS